MALTAEQQENQRQMLLKSGNSVVTDGTKRVTNPVLLVTEHDVAKRVVVPAQGQDSRLSTNISSHPQQQVAAAQAAVAAQVRADGGDAPTSAQQPKPSFIAPRATH